MPTNGWNEYKKLILSELNDSKQFRTEVRETLGSLKEDISALKVKAAIAGGIAGLVGTGVVTMLLSAFK